MRVPLILLLLALSFSVHAATMEELLVQFESINSTQLACEPTRNEATSVRDFRQELDRWHQYMSPLDSLKAMADMSHNLTHRYVYSPRWGWLDLKHMLNAADMTNHPLMSANLVLTLGEALETRQMLRETTSAWSYEDLTSNMLGAYFPTYMRQTSFPRNATLLDKFERYLRDLGAVENPLQVAPNASQLLRDVSEGESLGRRWPSTQDTQYRPRFTLPHTPTALDRRINSFKNRIMTERTLPGGGIIGR